ncbi:uncharacterized protein [Rutidosis leptorrhynchoides]|uniref:uncharacterized protein n=1 Tax=Rutidosis leptorrhynchoides TaxID=125765 RepID=UPI003A99C8F1
MKNKFDGVMQQIKTLDVEAYKYLIDKNPNTWSRAFFEMDRCCVAFENGISESYHNVIEPARHKPIISMLEDIRVYLMQRIFNMNQKAQDLQDFICPSVRKHLEILKKKLGNWSVYPSIYQEFEVIGFEESYSVNLATRKCSCRLWDASGIPCVHAAKAYSFVHKDPDESVSNWYTKQMWLSAYSYPIHPVTFNRGQSELDPILPPINRRMPGRPKKKRIRDPTEND